jgi:phosphatidylserine/phosphatidylglycerophosphate/cardiolipin synthase-like enzyme
MRLFAAIALWAALAPSVWAQEVHFSPEEPLDAIDDSLMGEAKHSIDFASYALTDARVLNALNAAAQRGVKVRIILDRRERHDFARLEELSDNVRVKQSGPLMHLKAYAIDGAILRTGSANFSANGETKQDNDLVIIRDTAATARFEAHFETMWTTAEPMIEFAAAIQAVEPH